jgi:hypothetical protein
MEIEKKEGKGDDKQEETRKKGNERNYVLKYTVFRL